MILAVRFLTIVPMPGREAAGPSALGRAAWWFPVVGLALGAALAAVAGLLEVVTPPLVGAALLATAWKVATGGIHLDGLADALDGLSGRDADRRLAIMRDERIGVFGAAGLVLVLVLFVAALAEIAVPVRSRLLLLAPLVGRVTPLIVGAWLRPATPGRGLGAAFSAGLSSWAGLTHGIAGLALAMWLLGPWGVAIVGGAWALALSWAGFVARRFGGITGDILGAVVELGELAVVLLGSMAVHRGLL